MTAFRTLNGGLRRAFRAASGAPLALLALLPPLALAPTPAAAQSLAGTPIDECVLVVENPYCGHSLQRTDGTLLGIEYELEQDPGTWVHAVGTLTGFECTSPCALPMVECIDLDALLLCDLGTGFCFGYGGGVSCPCGNEGSASRGCANSATGAGARFRTGGAPEVGRWMDLYLEGLPPNAPCVLFQGTTDVVWPMNDGLLCLGPPLRRLASFSADAAGTLQVPVVLSSLTGAVPGDVEQFQVWYADGAASPCGTGANLTNATRLDWLWAPAGF